MENQENEEPRDPQWVEETPSAPSRLLAILIVVFFAAAVLAVGYGYEQSKAVTTLNQRNQMMTASESQMRSQIDTLTAKINQLSAPPAETAPTPAPAERENAARTSSTHAARRATRPRYSAEDRHMKQMQAQLNEQQKQLKQTQDDIASARSDLEGKLGSTRDELNGSIARTHGELVALEKRGERNYYEFDLSKSKDFQREGPIQISLRKADSKHQSYDVMMLVDDHRLTKKKVDLYEPITLHESGEPQAVQIVVNQIDKNHIHGYVSAPKFTEAELTSSAAPASAGMNLNSTAISTSNTSSVSSSTPTATSSQAPSRPGN
ncbi:MAG: hypothetical protein ACRD4Y_12010 [Candidatus Acidiferrales bacterium]